MASRNKMEEVLHQTVYSQTEKKWDNSFWLLCMDELHDSRPTNGCSQQTPASPQVQGSVSAAISKKESKVMLQIGHTERVGSFQNMSCSLVRTCNALFKPQWDICSKQVGNERRRIWGSHTGGYAMQFFELISTDCTAFCPRRQNFSEN
jgi:hypothetical protein